MAGEWIKFETATLDKPEVLLMADLLETSADDVIGKLLRVWVWFDKNSIDGNAGGVTNVTLMKFLDRLVDRPGFAACMKKVGWLTDTGLPNFDRHNGKSAKNRALTQSRVNNFRNAHGVTFSLPEKRREEKNKTIVASDFVVPEWVPKDSWDAFVEMRKSIRKPLKTDHAKKLLIAELSKLRDAGDDPKTVLQRSIMSSWAGVFPLPKGGNTQPVDYDWTKDPRFEGVV